MSFVIVPLYKETRVDLELLVESLGAQKFDPKLNLPNFRGFHVIFSVDGVPETASLIRQVLHGKSPPIWNLDKNALTISDKSIWLSTQIICNFKNVGLRLNRCFAMNECKKYLAQGTLEEGATVVFIDGDSRFSSPYVWHRMVSYLLDNDNLGLVGAELRPIASRKCDGFQGYLLTALQNAELQCHMDESPIPWVMGGCFAFRLNAWFSEDPILKESDLAVAFAEVPSKSKLHYLEYGEDLYLTKLFRVAYNKGDFDGCDVCKGAIVETRLPVTLYAYLCQKRRWNLGRSAHQSLRSRIIEYSVLVITNATFILSLFSCFDVAAKMTLSIWMLTLITTMVNVVVLGRSGVFWLFCILWLWWLPILNDGIWVKLCFSYKVGVACWRQYQHPSDWFGIWLKEVFLMPLPILWVPLNTLFTLSLPQW